MLNHSVLQQTFISSDSIELELIQTERTCSVNGRLKQAKPSHEKLGLLPSSLALPSRDLTFLFDGRHLAVTRGRPARVSKLWRKRAIGASALDMELFEVDSEASFEACCSVW